MSSFSKSAEKLVTTSQVVMSARSEAKESSDFEKQYNKKMKDEKLIAKLKKKRWFYLLLTITFICC